MNKNIKITVNSTPDNPELGWGDWLVIYSGEGVNLYNCPASTCPNPYNPKNPEEKWNTYYGWIAPGKYKYEYYKSSKYGPCLLVERGGEVPSRVPNHRWKGRRVLKSILAHEGARGCKNKEWRGSAGCITLPPNYWKRFISHFNKGDSGYIEIAEPQKEGSMGLFSALKGKFLIGKAVIKAVKNTVAPTATVAIASDGDVPTTAIVAVVSWLVNIFIDYIKHR